MSADELFKAYETNEVATDERLAGKTVEVSGRVQAVDKDVWGEMYVSLQTANEFMPATMFIGAADKDKVAALDKGASVVVRCTQMMRWVGAPWAAAA